MLSTSEITVKSVIYCANVLTSLTNSSSLSGKNFFSGCVGITFSIFSDNARGSGIGLFILGAITADDVGISIRRSLLDNNGSDSDGDVGSGVGGGGVVGSGVGSGVGSVSGAGVGSVSGAGVGSVSGAGEVQFQVQV